MHFYKMDKKLFERFGWKKKLLFPFNKKFHFQRERQNGHFNS